MHRRHSRRRHICTADRMRRRQFGDSSLPYPYRALAAFAGSCWLQHALSDCVGCLLDWPPARRNWYSHASDGTARLRVAHRMKVKVKRPRPPRETRLRARSVQGRTDRSAARPPPPPHRCRRRRRRFEPRARSNGGPCISSFTFLLPRTPTDQPQLVSASAGELAASRSFSRFKVAAASPPPPPPASLMPLQFTAAERTTRRLYFGADIFRPIPLLCPLHFPAHLL